VIDDKKYNLKGSESRDAWKLAHKQKLGRGYYGSDIDYAVVEFRTARIVAFYDYKKPRDSISKTEVIAYNDLIKLAPMYIVEGPCPAEGPFKISRYIGGKLGNYGQEPLIELEFVQVCEDWEAFRLFEDKLRGRNGTRAND